MAETPDSTAWQRLGTLLERRRVELDPRYKNLTLFAKERGVDARMAWDIERARRTNFRRPTRRALEVAYGWQAGSIDSVLEGGVPMPLPVQATVHVLSGSYKPPDPEDGFVRPRYEPGLEEFAREQERLRPDVSHRDIAYAVDVKYLGQLYAESQERIRELEAELARKETENERLRGDLKRAHLRVTG
jgi:hypothetical protein